MSVKRKPGKERCFDNVKYMPACSCVSSMPISWVRSVPPRMALGGVLFDTVLDSQGDSPSIGGLWRVPPYIPLPTYR